LLLDSVVELGTKTVDRTVVFAVVVDMIQAQKLNLGGFATSTAWLTAAVVCEYLYAQFAYILSHHLGAALFAIVLQSPCAVPISGEKFSGEWEIDAAFVADSSLRLGTDKAPTTPASAGAETANLDVANFATTTTTFPEVLLAIRCLPDTANDCPVIEDLAGQVESSDRPRPTFAFADAAHEFPFGCCGSVGLYCKPTGCLVKSNTEQRRQQCHW
jgi:hypothetical protein